MRGVILGLTAMLLAGSAQAATFTEVGDAGSTLATAAATGASGATLTDIFGGLGSAGDADLFKIYIFNPAAFSATTNNDDTVFDLDTELYLFDAAGHAIAANDDDASGLVLNSTLPTGNSRYAGLAAGYYFLGISNSGNEPVNSVNQLLFATGLTTTVRGPAGGLNPTTLFGFDEEQPDYSAPGAYRINLTGVSAGPSAAPEPGAWALLLAGVALTGGALRSRRRLA